MLNVLQLSILLRHTHYNFILYGSQMSTHDSSDVVLEVSFCGNRGRGDTIRSSEPSV